MPVNLHTYLASESFVSDNLVPRPELISRLNSIVSLPLILINSGAGTGKTSLLYSFKKHINSYTLWLQGSAKISDGFSLVAHIAYSIGKNSQGSFQNTLQIIENRTNHSTGKQITLADAASAFCNDLYVLLEKTPAIKFIIDDFHLIAEGNHKDTGINEFLEILLMNPVKGFTLIISTRHSITFDSARLKSKRMMKEFSEKDLKFNKNEIKELAKLVYQKDLTSVEIDSLSQLSAGWVTGLHLLLQHAGITGTFADSEIFYDYFIEEILNSLPVNVKEFLLSTSFLEYFTVELCDYLFDNRDSARIIKELIEKNIFVELISFDNLTDNKHYSYQKLFKEFLITYSAQLPFKTIIETLTDKAINFYTSKKDYSAALNYFRGKRNNEALISYFNDHILKDEHETNNYIYASVIGDLPVELIKNNISVLSYYVHICDLSLSFSSTHIDLIESLYPYEKASGLLLKANYYLHSGFLNKAETTLKMLPEDKLTDGELVKYYRVYSRVLYRKGFNYSGEVKQKCELGLNLAFKLNDKTSITDLCGLLGNTYDNTSEYLNAIHYYKSAIDFDSNIIESFKNLTNLINTHTALGEINTAKEKLELVEILQKKFPLATAGRFIRRSKEKLYAKLTDFETCISFLINTIEDGTLKNNNELLWANYMNISNMYLLINDDDMAFQFLKLAEKYSVNSYNKLLNSYMHIKLEQYRNTFSSETEKILLQCIRFHKDNNLLSVISQFYFETSKYYFFIKAFDSSLQFLRLSFKNVSKNLLKDFIVNEIFVCVPIFDFARHNKLGIEFIKQAVQTIIEYSESELISIKAKERLKIVSVKLTDIKLLAFGKTEIYLRGEPIPEDKWIRKKSKILLVYLMSDPGRIHTKDEIMDIFFNDMPADKADVVYHSAIYNIRTTLKIYDIKSDKPKRSKDKTYDYNPQYILYEDKTLKLNPDFYYKADNIEFEKLYEKSKLPAHTIEEKINYSMSAIELYKGDYLPGYYDSWCEELRVKYKNMYITLCEDLIKMLEAEARFDEVIKYSELLLKEDKLNDPAHISIINAFQKLGNIKLANSRYDIMLKIYDEELGEKPQPKTLDKITLILSEAKDLT